MEMVGTYKPWSSTPKIKLVILGSVVHYYFETLFGAYWLPAVVIAFESEGFVSLRVFTDTTGSEWIVSAKMSTSRQPGTCHLK